MRRTTLLTLLALITLITCKQNNGYTSITPEEFKITIEREHTQLVDVRTAEEHAQGHISGSINIDVKQEKFIERATTTLDKANTIALYCRSGRRSKTAAKQLSQAGYKVVELEGGYNTWQEKDILLVTHEIKHLLNNHTQKAQAATSDTERAQLLDTLIARYNTLCNKHEKQLKSFTDKVKAGNKEAIQAEKELRKTLEEFTTIINK